MSVIERIQRGVSTTSAIVLLIVFALGVLYDVFHRFGPREVVYSLGSPEEVLILLASLLCFGLATERLLTLHKIEDTVHKASSQREILLEKLDRILKELGTLQSTVAGEFDGVEKKEVSLLREVRKINTAEPLIGTKAIGDAAKAILEISKDNDIITASNHSEEDPLSEWYGKLVADRVATAKRNGGDMEYNLIMPPRTDSNSKLEDSRRKLFRENQIGDRLNIKRAKQPSPLDVLFVGNSMIIALRGASQRATYVAAVRVNNAEFVEKASEWYREVGWETANSDS